MAQRCIPTLVFTKCTLGYEEMFMLTREQRIRTKLQSRKKSNSKITKPIWKLRSYTKYELWSECISQMSRMKRGGIISYPNGVIPEMAFKKNWKKRWEIKSKKSILMILLCIYVHACISHLKFQYMILSAYSLDLFIKSLSSSNALILFHETVWASISLLLLSFGTIGLRCLLPKYMQYSIDSTLSIKILEGSV